MIGRSVRAPKAVILRGDDAVDWAQSSWDKYVESGFDPKYLVLLPGGQPTTFTIAQLTHAQRGSIDTLGSSALVNEFLIRCCLRSVSNYQVVRPDGSTLLVSGEPERNPAGNLGSTITDKWMEETFAPLSEQRDTLGDLIRKNSEAPLPLSKPAAAGSGA